jgi:membrane protease YdiL (CAAX protease family)
MLSEEDGERSRTHTIGSMWRALPAPSPAHVAAAWTLLAAAWVGHVALFSRVRPGMTFVRRLFGGVPAETIAVAAAAVCLAVLFLGVLRRSATVAGSALVMLAFLAGNALYFGPLARLYLGGSWKFATLTDGLRFSANRTLYLAAVGGAMAVAWLFVDRQVFAFLRAGDLGVATQWSRKESGPWSGYLGGLALTAVLPAALILQATVGFRPIRSGAIVAALPAIALASLVNALAEETIFRGFVQPAAIRLLGFGRGLWLQGLFFGLVHWGASVGARSALPVSLAIGVGSVVFGKSVLETRGLAWAILAHGMFDVAVFSAYFVR